MARVFTQAEAKQLGLPGRNAMEIVSASTFNSLEPAGVIPFGHRNMIAP